MDIEVQFQSVAQQFEETEVQNMDEENLKTGFEFPKWTPESFPKTEMTFQDILEYFCVIPA